jgi:hypothetical protein
MFVFFCSFVVQNIFKKKTTFYNSKTIPNQKQKLIINKNDKTY